MSRRGWVLPLKFHPLRWKYVDDVHIYLLYEYYTVGVVRVADGRTLRLRHGVPSWQLFLDPRNLQVEIGWIFTKIELHGDPLGYLQKKRRKSDTFGCIHRRIALRPMDPFKSWNIHSVNSMNRFLFISLKIVGIGATLRVTRLLPERYQQWRCGQVDSDSVEQFNCHRCSGTSIWSTVTVTKHSRHSSQGQLCATQQINQSGINQTPPLCALLQSLPSGTSSSRRGFPFKSFFFPLGRHFEFGGIAPISAALGSMARTKKFQIYF